MNNDSSSTLYTLLNKAILKLASYLYKWMHYHKFRFRSQKLSCGGTALITSSHLGSEYIARNPLSRAATKQAQFKASIGRLQALYVAGIFNLLPDHIQEPYVLSKILGELTERGVDLFNCLVQDYACNTNEEKLHAIVQIILGVQALHIKNLVHRDIKPENVIFVNGQWKLIDLEDVCDASQNNISIAGTLDEVPPEYTSIISFFLAQKEHLLNYTVPRGSLNLKAIDMWMLGKLILLVFKLPEIPDGFLRFERNDNTSCKIQKLQAFSQENPVLLRNNLEKYLEKYKTFFGDKFYLIDLIKGLLEPDPNERWTIEKVFEHLKKNSALPESQVPTRQLDRPEWYQSNNIDPHFKTSRLYLNLVQFYQLLLKIRQAKPDPSDVLLEVSHLLKDAKDINRFVTCPWKKEGSEKNSAAKTFAALRAYRNALRHTTIAEPSDAAASTSSASHAAKANHM